MLSMLSLVHGPSTTISNDETFLEDFLEIPKEILRKSSDVSSVLNALYFGIVNINLSIFML